MVHGEPDVMDDFERVLAERDRNALMVEYGKPYELG